MGSIQKRGTLAVMLVLLLAAWPSSASGAKPRDVMLLFHAGGFMLGDPSLMDLAAQKARDAGFKPVAVPYQLGSVGEALKDAKRAARAFPPDRNVFAYGESSGGTLAALIAQDDEVDAAVAYAPIAKVDHWEGSRYLVDSRHELRQASPARRATAQRVHALVPQSDGKVSSRHTRRWARRDPLVSHVTVPGRHGFVGTDWYPENMELGIRWLMRRASRG